MSENVQEQKLPSKEELIQFLQEQIDVKKVQVELQELNAQLAEARAREIKALSFIGQVTNPQSQGQPHTVTQEDLDQNPELAEQGFKVGDQVVISTEPIQPEESEEKPQRGLKKKK
jgi:hypothetical protein